MYGRPLGDPVSGRMRVWPDDLVYEGPLTVCGARRGGAQARGGEKPFKVWKLESRVL